MTIPKIKVKVLKELAKTNHYLLKTIEHRELRGFNCRYLILDENDMIVGKYNNLMDILKDYKEAK